ncbi:Serine/Threonine protein kinases active-site signature [Nakaseomyces glabratus]|nr:Serine/Threonine protein kinases active-site signature [Nakaseomyces glabratus]
MFKVKTLERRNLKQLSLGGGWLGGSAHTGSEELRHECNGNKLIVEDMALAVGSDEHIEPHSGSGSASASSMSGLSIHDHAGDAAKPVTLAVDGHSGCNYDLRDLVQLGKLGSGNSGTVMKVLHVPSSRVIAKKTIVIEQNNAIVKQQIYRELTIMRSVAEHRNIVEFYGAHNLSSDSINGSNDVVILMEYMNCGSLDTITRTYKSLQRRGILAANRSYPVQEWFSKPVIISRIAYSVLNGLSYLYENYKIIHRDIKPSNVLINSKGRIKLCDFGVSRKLNNSIADTFVGTSTYMSPERIQGNKYTTKGDVWSLGLMLIELLTGEFPLGGHNDTPDGILDLLQRIVNEPAPKLPSSVIKVLPPDMVNFIDLCCVKVEKDRGSLQELLKHPFIVRFRTKESTDAFKLWTKDIRRWMQEERNYKKETSEHSMLLKKQHNTNDTRHSRHMTSSLK